MVFMEILYLQFFFGIGAYVLVFITVLWHDRQI